MSFNAIMMSQLGKTSKSLRIEILQILQAATDPLCCIDIFELSDVANTSRDISLEMTQLKERKLVDIVDKRAREDFRPVAFYRITQEGIHAIPVQPERMAA